MHQRAVLCTMCGGKFFPASLAFHQKACARKQNFVLLPCPYCDVEVPKPELNTHIASACKKAPKNVQTSKEGGGGRRSSASASAGDSSAAAQQETGIFDEAGRMCCPVCNRWFSQDRIGKHQAICRKIEDNHKRKKRPVFDSFQQRKFDPLIQRSDVEERYAKMSASGAVDPSALKAARSYYAGRQLQQTKEGHTPAASRTECITAASRKSKSPGVNAEKISEKAKPKWPGVNAEKISEKAKPTRSRAAGTRDTHVVLGASVTSRPPTAASKGGKRASGASPLGTTKPLAANSSAAAARRGVAVSEKNASQPAYAQNKSKSPVQQPFRGSPPPVRTDNSCKTRSSPFVGGGRGGGGGAILESNEASIENTLAYPNYPADWDATNGVHESASPASAIPRSAGPRRVQNTSRSVNVSGRVPHGGGAGAILQTNETSADNPLAFPYG